MKAQRRAARKRAATTRKSRSPEKPKVKTTRPRKKGSRKSSTADQREVDLDQLVKLLQLALSRNPTPESDNV